jgi:hypothetical protein
MANSKGRRKLRRLRKEGRQSMPPPPPSEPRKEMAKPILKNIKRIPRWFYLSIVLGTLIVTLLEGYPWLSIQRDDSLSSTNPLATTFSISNEGYVPVTDLQANCTFSFGNKDSPMHVQNNTIGYDDYFSTWLPHGATVTTPCFDALEHMAAIIIGPPYKDPRNFIETSLIISISYSFFHINQKRFRRLQTFHFSMVRGDDNSPHWIYAK